MTAMVVSEVSSGVVFAVGLYTGVEEVSQWGGRHGSEVCVVDTGWVELSAVGESGTVVVSVRDTGGTAGFVVAREAGDVSETSGSLEVVV